MKINSTIQFNKMFMSIFSLLTLFLLVPDLAMAVPPHLEFVPPPEDEFMKIIHRMFGGVVDLNGGDSTALTDIIVAWSSFTLVIGGGLVSYGLVMGTMNTAHQGEALGKNWNSMWVPLRTLMAVAAVMPLPASVVNNGVPGISAVQGGIIQITRMATGMADSLWAYSIQQMSIKGLDRVTFKSGFITEFGDSLFKSLVCKKAVIDNGHFSSTKSKDSISSFLLKRNNHEYDLNIGVKSSTNLEKLRYCGGFLITMPEDLFASVKPDALSFIDKPNSIKLTQKEKDNLKDSDNSKLVEMKKASLKKYTSSIKDGRAAFERVINPVVQDFQEIADAYVDSKNGKGTFDIKEQSKKYGAALDKIYAALVYTSNVLSKVKAVDNITTDSIAKEGWSKAGSYYWEVSRLQGVKHNIISSFNIKRTSGQSDSASTVMSTQKVSLLNLQLVINSLEKEMQKSKNSTISSTKEFNKNIDESVSLDKGSGEGYLMGLLRDALYGNMFDGEGMGAIKGDPILMAKHLGDRLTNTLIGGYFTVVVIRSIAEGIKAGSSVSGLSNMLGVGEVAKTATISASAITAALAQGVTKLLLPIFMVLIPILFMYSTLIPSLPYIMFLFALVGYLIYFTEAMIASPIWAIFHAHPEGEDFTGKFGANGYMIAFGLLTRPTLIILGFVAGMALVHNLGIFLYDTFFHFGNSMSESSSNILGPIFRTLLYGILLSYIIYKSFELTYELPRAVTDWIGGQHKDMGESGGKQVIVGAATGVASNVGQAAQGAATRSAIKDQPTGDEPSGGVDDLKKKKSTNQASTEQNTNAPAVEPTKAQDPEGGRKK